MPFPTNIYLLAACLAISACASPDDGTILKPTWESRYGPNPSLKVQKVEQFVDQQTGIVNALLKTSGTDEYEDAVIAGFNFVDNQCDMYLRSLYVINRQKDRTKQGLNAANMVSSAILQATSASTLSMGIVTQAFGLATQYTDTVFDGYTYGSSAGTVKGIVSKLQTAYRGRIGLDKIDSHPKAFQAIRGYLELCLPPTIEENIEKTLSQATATATDNADGTVSATLASE